MWRVYIWSLHLISFSTMLPTIIHEQNRCTPFRKKNFYFHFLSLYYSYRAKHRLRISLLPMWRVYIWSLHLISFSTMLPTIIHEQNRCTPFRKKFFYFHFLSLYYSYRAKRILRISLLPMWRVYIWSLHLISFSTMLPTIIHEQNRCTPSRKKKFYFHFLSLYYSYTANIDWGYHCYLCEGCTSGLCISYHLVPCYQPSYMNRIDVHILEKKFYFHFLS